MVESLRQEPESSQPEPLWRDVLGERLRKRRHERAETLTEIARRSGISAQYLSEIERGLKEPSSEMIAAVAGALDLTLLDLTVQIAQELSMATVAAAQGASRAAYALAA